MPSNIFFTRSSLIKKQQNFTSIIFGTQNRGVTDPNRAFIPLKHSWNSFQPSFVSLISPRLFSLILFLITDLTSLIDRLLVNLRCLGPDLWCLAPILRCLAPIRIDQRDPVGRFYFISPLFLDSWAAYPSLPPSPPPAQFITLQLPPPKRDGRIWRFAAAFQFVSFFTEKYSICAWWSILPLHPIHYVTTAGMLHADMLHCAFDALRLHSSSAKDFLFV